MRRLLRTVVVAALALAAVPNLEAQRIADLPRLAAYENGGRAQSPGRVKIGDHRLEGLVLGAVTFGFVGLLAANSLCSGDSAPGTSCSPQTGASFAVGAGIGAALGYVLGRTVPKYGPDGNGSAR